MIIKTLDEIETSMSLYGCQKQNIT